MHQIIIEPWPNYDDQKRAWWPVNVVGPCGKFSLAWTSADGGRWADSNELRRLKNRNGRLMFRVEEAVRATLGGVTEKRDSVTENSGTVTAESVTVSRAHALPLEGMSRLSRVTDNSVTVTDERDSDSYSPSVRNRHGQSAKASKNLKPICPPCSGNCAQGRHCPARFTRARISLACLRAVRDVLLMLTFLLLVAAVAQTWGQR